MNDVSKAHVRKLTELVLALQDERLEITGELMVLSAAMYSMVQTHPDHQAFADQFRRAWREFGDWHADGDQDPALHRGIDKALSLAEQACSVPLQVRAPRD